MSEVHFTILACAIKAKVDGTVEKIRNCLAIVDLVPEDEISEQSDGSIRSNSDAPPEAPEERPDAVNNASSQHLQTPDHSSNSLSGQQSQAPEERPDAVSNASSQHSDHSSNSHSGQQSERDPCCNGKAWIIAALALAVVVIAGVAVLALVFTTGPSDSPPTLHPTSPTPTSPPTSPPQDQELLELLPQYTVDSISQDPESPQAKAWNWVQKHPQFGTMDDWRKKQLMALGSFYYATDGDAWVNNNFWVAGSLDECDWIGAECVYGRYRELSLLGFFLQGTIPPEISFLSSG